MRNTFFYILILLLPAGLFSQHPDSLFSSGQSAYDSGNYKTAIDHYSQILRQGKESAQLHYNLGNAYFKSDELGEAILHYEKAQRLNPRDNDIGHNLSIARVRVQDQINPPDKSLFMEIFDGIKYFLTVNELAIMVIFTLLAASVLFAAWKVIDHRRVRVILGNLLAAVLFFFVLLAPLLVARTYETQKQIHGIILDEEIQARAAPQQLSTTVFAIHEGTKVKLEQAQNDWYHIRLLDGKEGWIPQESVGII